jgi:hypothetical protein
MDRDLTQFIMGLAVCALGTFVPLKSKLDLAPEVEMLLQTMKPNTKMKAHL